MTSIIVSLKTTQCLNTLCTAVLTSNWIHANIRLTEWMQMPSDYKFPPLHNIWLFLLAPSAFFHPAGSIKVCDTPWKLAANVYPGASLLSGILWCYNSTRVLLLFSGGSGRSGFVWNSLPLRQCPSYLVGTNWCLLGDPTRFVLTSRPIGCRVAGCYWCWVGLYSPFGVKVLQHCILVGALGLISPRTVVLWIQPAPIVTSPSTHQSNPTPACLATC